ncbi:hypothetical protein DPMN_156906 [Dreissena polymorpha]|uniref:Uncharacterized protein n=1 Tax=Dreissena polymorpha TaxID=45954 RepID=A0A9D4FV33_DREPO|nr:hypothetical protein DPMN_156906 [Dreissena polymorpha]
MMGRFSTRPEMASGNTVLLSQGGLFTYYCYCCCCCCCYCYCYYYDYYYDYYYYYYDDDADDADDADDDEVFDDDFKRGDWITIRI